MPESLTKGQPLSFPGDMAEHKESKTASVLSVYNLSVQDVLQL
jgi:hypothetical protein